MLWDAAIWRMINEARRHSETLSGGDVTQNGMIHNFIDRAFFNGQAIMIRRLYEPEAPNKQRQVSLRGLIKDIKRNSHLLTLDNIRNVSGLDDKKLLFHLKKIMFSFNEIGVKRIITITKPETPKAITKIFQNHSDSNSFTDNSANSVAEAEVMLDNISKFLKI